jgi:hypothetical protein
MWAAAAAPLAPPSRFHACSWAKSAPALRRVAWRVIVPVALDSHALISAAPACLHSRPAWE